jgi:hypothetical protein
MATELRGELPPVLGSITSAFGMALGELLVALGRAAELGRCLTGIHVAAQGTILSSDLVHCCMSPREED